MTETAPENLLILDLDETLVHASSVKLDVPADFVVGPFFVYLRPGLDQFLRTMARHFRLAVWSSSSSDYLAAILRCIVPETIRLEFQWGRSRCTLRYHQEWQQSYWVKNLKKVKREGYDLDRVLIVDDTPRKLELNYGNAVYVSPFEGDPQDEELPLLTAYLKSLAKETLLRSIEKRSWRQRTRELLQDENH